MAGVIGFDDSTPRSRGSIPDMDCNNATLAGTYHYYTEQGSLSNSPDLLRFLLNVAISANRIVQTAVSFSTATEENGYGLMKTRTFTGNTWTPWVER